jgi:hypothetical protein
MSIDLSKEENQQKLGKDYGLISGGWLYSNKHEAMIVYMDGIPYFDARFGEHKFVETDCLFQINPFENAMVFFLSYNNLHQFHVFGIWRQDILSLELTENTSIIVPNFSMLKATMPLGFPGGIGYAIASFRKQKEAERRQFKVIGTKEKKGTIAKLNFRDDENGATRTITLNIPKDHYDYCIKTILEVYWTNKLKFESK